MNIATDITLNYSKKDLEQLLREQADRDGYEVVSIKFDYGTRTEGYGMAEHDTAYFGGVKVKVKPKTQVSKDQNDKTIISDQRGIVGAQG